MRPVTYTLTTTIPAPPERVFETLTDPHRMVLWLPATRAVEAPGEGPLRKGSRIRVVYDARDTEIEVVDWNPPRVFGWAERVGRRHWRTYFRLEFAGSATQLTVSQVWDPPSLLAWLKVKLRPHRNVPAKLSTMMQNLRTVIAK